MTRWISWSRPMTGSSLEALASAVRSRVNSLRVLPPSLCSPALAALLAARGWDWSFVISAE